MVAQGPPQKADGLISAPDGQWEGHVWSERTGRDSVPAADEHGRARTSQEEARCAVR